jgi:hypothetical protein
VRARDAAFLSSTIEEGRRESAAVALDSAAMRDALAATLGPVTFGDLRAHVVRGAVIVVAPSLDLLDVAVCVAKDDKTAVGAWIEAGLLGKPSANQLAAWSAFTEPRLRSVVVAPYVLVQEPSE